MARDLPSVPRCCPINTTLRFSLCSVPNFFSRSERTHRFSIYRYIPIKSLRSSPICQEIQAPAYPLRKTPGSLPTFEAAAVGTNFSTAPYSTTSHATCVGRQVIGAMHIRIKSAGKLLVWPLRVPHEHRRTLHLRHVLAAPKSIASTIVSRQIVFSVYS
jgi:hypothetical protein